MKVDVLSCFCRLQVWHEAFGVLALRHSIFVILRRTDSLSKFKPSLPTLRVYNTSPWLGNKGNLTRRDRRKINYCIVLCCVVLYCVVMRVSQRVSTDIK